MTEFALYIAASLDGYIADADGGVGWLDSFEDRYEDGVAGESSYESFFETVDCLVMGSHTYEQIVTEFVDDPAEDWPYGGRPTYVTTSRDLPRATDEVEFFAGDLRELASELAGEYETVWLGGGAALARTFLRLDLLDEIRLSVIPVLLGEGISLFGELGVGRALHLEDVTAFESGIAELRYAVEPGRPDAR